MIILGISVLVYSFFEIRVWGSLYFDRDYYCIERMRKQTKLADALSVLHNAVKLFFGITVIVTALRRWIPVENQALAHMVLLVSFGLLVVDILALEGFTRARGLRELRDGIRQQWKKEKRISADHDHEVNLYRGTVRVTETYPKHVITMVICIGIMQLLFA